MSNETAGNLVPISQFADIDGRKLAQHTGARLTREEKRTLRIQEMLPRGITIGFRPDGREKPFYVRYGADRRTEGFISEKERNDRAQVLMEAAEQEGKAVLAFDPAEWKKYLLFRQETGVTLDEAKEIVLRVKGNLRLNLTVTEGVAKYLQRRKDEGMHYDSFIHLRVQLNRLAAHLGYLPLFGVTPDHIREWMAKMRDGQLQGCPKLGPLTLRHHRKSAHLFFEKAQMEKWALENPCVAVANPRVAKKRKPVLSAYDAFCLLKANRTHPIIGRLVIEFYGFLRCASVERLKEPDLHRKTRGIEMHGPSVDDKGEWQQGHKSGQRMFRQGQPAVLWEWIDHCCPLPRPPEGYPCFTEIHADNYDEKKKQAFVRAHVLPHHNILRHSCITNMLAATRNTAEVSRLAQHSTIHMTLDYEGMIDETDAKMILSMTPAATLLSWEEFQLRWQDYTPDAK